MSAIGQIYYRVVDTSSTGEGRHYISSGIDIYNDVVNASSARQFTKVGIQAPPGAQVVMNASKTIMIGRTGIYELDEDIAITSMYFVRPKNYIKDEEETELKKQQGEKIIKDAKAALELLLKHQEKSLPTRLLRHIKPIGMAIMRQMILIQQLFKRVVRL